MQGTELANAFLTQGIAIVLSVASVFAAIFLVAKGSDKLNTARFRTTLWALFLIAVTILLIYSGIMFLDSGHYLEAVGIVVSYAFLAFSGWLSLRAPVR